MAMFKFINIILMSVIVCACSGIQTYPNVAMPGETVSIGMGWQKQFKRSNTTVTIIPSNGIPVVYLPNDPAIRAIFNMYPDPVSNLVVGNAMQDNINFNSGYSYGSLISNNFTNGDMDWWQTVAFIDLPINIPAGEAEIQLTNSQGDTATSIVQIIDGTGTGDIFNVEANGPLDQMQLDSLERAPNFEVSIQAQSIPYALEFSFTHAGNVYIVNPTSNKNVMWSDDGSVLKVFVVPSTSSPLTNIHDFKFYISGITAVEWVQAIQPLILDTFKAFDIDGHPISGVTVNVDQYVN